MLRTIKRYENRKLYDLEARRYVRLRELVDLIRAGDEVKVIDNATGEDLTAQTLAKAISEGEGGKPLLPSQSLHEVLRWSENLVAGGVSRVDAWIDRLVQKTVERSGPSRSLRKEMARLRERLAELEAMVGNIEEDKENGRNDDGCGRPDRRA